jgi:nitrogen regulatory protein PII
LDAGISTVRRTRAPSDGSAPVERPAKVERSQIASPRRRQAGGIRQVSMTLLRVVTSPDRASAILDALLGVGIAGMTITDVKGTAAGQRQRVTYRGTDYDVSYVPRVELQMVLPDDWCSDAINEIMEVARAEAGGENRIFVIPIEAAYRIRTGEVEYARSQPQS